MDAMFSNPFGSFIKNLVNHGCQLQGGHGGRIGKSRATWIWFALRDGNRFKNMFVSSNSCCSFGTFLIGCKVECVSIKCKNTLHKEEILKLDMQKKITQPNLNFKTMLNNGSYVSKQRGRRTRKQNDTKQIGLMFGGWHLPFSPCHQFSKMWDHEGLAFQDLRHFYFVMQDGFQNNHAHANSSARILFLTHGIRRHSFVSRPPLEWRLPICIVSTHLTTLS